MGTPPLSDVGGVLHGLLQEAFDGDARLGARVVGDTAAITPGSSLTDSRR